MLLSRRPRQSIFSLLFGLLALVSYLYHIWWMLRVSNGLMLLIGAVIPPIGIIHSWMHWTGFA